MNEKLNDAILAVRNFDQKELNDLVDAIKTRRSILAAKALNQFRRGDKVSFIARHGIRKTGKIVKFNQKTVSVEVGPYETWRVSPSLLKPAN